LDAVTIGGVCTLQPNMVDYAAPIYQHNRLLNTKLLEGDFSAFYVAYFPSKNSVGLFVIEAKLFKFHEGLYEHRQLCSVYLLQLLQLLI
jgi:hypothetical protein